MNLKSTNKYTFDVEKKILKEAGLKMTPGRLSVLKYFKDFPTPSNTEIIYKKIGREKIDLATIYRILNSFLKHKLIRRVEIGGKAVYYELADKIHHHHLICINCRKIRDIEGCNFEEILNKVRKKNSDFSEIKTHSFEVFGVCNVCAKLKK